MPIKKIAEIINSNSDVPILILCEHASASLPDETEDNLGLSLELMSSHNACDLGARELAITCTKNLKCTAILGIYSRLWIDLNRKEDSENLIIKEVEDSPIKANKNLTSKDKEHRLNNYYRPFHTICRKNIERINAVSKKNPLVVTIHSFTRKIKGETIPRPWDIGLLYNKDKNTHDIFNYYLSSKYESNLIGHNQPYNLKDFSIPIESLANEKNCPHIAIEICDDKLESSEDIIKWSKLITGAIKSRLEN